MTWITLSDADKPILEEIEKQTDRAAALIATSYLEDRLVEAIKARTVRDQNVEKDMFRNSGPLGSFSAKIDLGFMLGSLRWRGPQDAAHGQRHQKRIRARGTTEGLQFAAHSGPLQEHFHLSRFENEEQDDRSNGRIQAGPGRITKNGVHERDQISTACGRDGDEAPAAADAARTFSCFAAASRCIKIAASCRRARSPASVGLRRASVDSPREASYALPSASRHTAVIASSYRRATAANDTCARSAIAASE
jgi:hypothetical protein